VRRSRRAATSSTHFRREWRPSSATAALDSESEEAIREALSRLMRGRTVIAIAHRLATLRNFDRVVVLQAGRIIEDGPPDILLQGKGPYRELVAREMGRLATRAA